MSPGDYMTYDYTIIYSRVSADTPFYPIPQNVLDHIDSVWRADDKMITSETLSEDGLTKISNITFKDVNIWLEFIDDPVIKTYIVDRNVYHAENDITVIRLEG
jgi:hypothetical protein